MSNSMTDWTIILRSLRARLFSTVTTIVTVAVAVALMLVLLMMRDSGRRAFERGSGNMHLLISADASPLVSILNGIFYANPPRRPIAWAQYNEIAAKFPLDFAIPTQLGDSYRGNPVLATIPEFFTKFQPVPKEPWKLAQGTFFDTEWQVVLGARAAASTGLKLGEKIALTHGSGGSREKGGTKDGAPGHVHNEFKYTVVGILEPTGSAHDRALFTNLNSTWIIHAFDRRERAELVTEKGSGTEKEKEKEKDHDHDAAHDDHDHAHDDHAHDEPPMTVADITDEDRKVTGAFIRLITREGSDSPANLPQVFDMLRRDPTITVAQPNQEITRLFEIVGNIDQILVGMAGVVMASSGIAIMLALYNSMEQRRRQIAVLRVLGASQSRIFGLVLTESALVGVLGAILGLVVSLLGVRVVTAIMRERLGLVIEPLLTPEAAMLVIVATVALGVLAGFIPALMAYRTPVAKNLKPVG